jgi:FMN phosphatase YigB (HAD superfamily)
MKVVFDLDGTLADNTARQHLARDAAKADDKDKEAAWNVFHDGIPFDPPIDAVVKVARAMYADGHRVEIWTARPERYRQQTLAWLCGHSIPFDTLKMRRDDEGRVPAVTIKTRWYEEADEKPGLIFEDHPGVVKAFRELGVIAAQVGEEPQK